MDKLRRYIDKKAVRNKKIYQYYLKQVAEQQKSFAQIYQGIEYHYGVKEDMARNVIYKLRNT